MELAALEPLVAQLNRINQASDIGPGGSVTQLSAPSSLTIERFNEVMNAAPISPSDVMPADVSSAVLPVSFSPGIDVAKPTLGEEILGQLRGYVEEVAGGADRINNRLATMATKEPTPQDLLALQVETMNWSISTSLGTGIISSVQKSFESLTKMS